MASNARLTALAYVRCSFHPPLVKLHVSTDTHNAATCVLVCAHPVTGLLIQPVFFGKASHHSAVPVTSPPLKLHRSSMEIRLRLIHGNVGEIKGSLPGSALSSSSWRLGSKIRRAISVSLPHLGLQRNTRETLIYVLPQGSSTGALAETQLFRGGWNREITKGGENTWDRGGGGGDGVIPIHKLCVCFIVS